MHYLTLITAEIPALAEDEQKNKAIAGLISKLEQEKEQPSKSPLCLQNIFLEKYRNMRDTFSRAVNSSAENILEPYYSGTDNPDYLEFWDKTQELESAYGQAVDCFQLPQGCIVPYYHSGACSFTLHNGQVYKRHAGPLNHQKRTKSAKRIKAIPNYPIKKLYPSFSDYATEYWGFSYDPEHEAYGFYYNPNAFYDWYSIGGRWPDLFLVKEGCKECSAGERSFFHYGTEIPCPEGYKWACAARKKDIEWQAIAGWRLSCAKKQFHSLEKLFLTGERDDGIHGIITDKGILYRKKLVYEKNETEEQYLSRLNFSHYPVNFYGLLSGKEWITKDSFPIAGESSDPSRNTWQKTFEDYIDSLSDDTVLIGVDCHM